MPTASANPYRAALCAVLLLGASLLPAAPRAQKSAGPAPAAESVQLEIGKLDSLDLRTNTAVLSDVMVIAQGIKVQAKKATALGGQKFSNNQWKFSHDVHIATADSTLSADQADVTFVDNRVSRAIATGSPAAFEHRLEKGGDIARGNAASIEYDVSTGIVVLKKNATITLYQSDGNKTICSDNITYNLRTQNLSARSGCNGSQRLRMTIPVDATTGKTSAILEGALKSTRPKTESPAAKPPAGTP